ncbi:MAG TPA: hypothetical protein VK589_20810 [Chryseolinea sp.]|nr:hypothetical protein [Chryseolinea sp.]
MNYQIRKIQPFDLRNRRQLMRSCLWMLLLISCEIEDDFGKPDDSTFFGEALYSSSLGIGPIIWSDATNEIVSLNTSGVTTTNVNTRHNRHLSIDAFSPDWESLRLAGNKIYFTNTSYELASVNLTSMAYTPSIIDSVHTGYSLTFFEDKYLAFGRYRPSDLSDPSLFLFDLATGKETYITSGTPYLFSPDGSQLLFNKEYAYYTYNLQTKAIVAVGNPSSHVLKWTPEGIISYSQVSSSVRVFNETTKQIVGTWPSVGNVLRETISPSGNRVITMQGECGVPITLQGCSHPSYYYSVVDVNSKEQFETIDSNYVIDMRAAFSPDEKKFAYVKDGTTIYLTSEP